MLRKIRNLLGRRKPSDANGPETLPPVHHGPQVVHRPLPTENLDPDAVKIVNRLSRFEHKTYLVGGCVRDLLLERQPKDFDIGTSATPRQIKRLFRNCRIIGRRFRLAHIYFQQDKIIEVATFRASVGKEPEDDSDDLLIRDDNRFGTPEEDALRRDFTINALFYDIGDEMVIDHTGGLEDLRQKLVRTIGDPEIRFREDPIRIIRAIKFAARLGFTIESGTLKALKKTCSELPKAAAPRIMEELNRFGREKCARHSFEILRETGVFDHILPELVEAYKNADTWQLLLHLLEGLDHRSKAGQQNATGEIFTCLILPTLTGALGWDTPGAIEPQQTAALRTSIDDILRPIAVRLRISRREQERCRQIITILARLALSEKMRPSSRRSVMQRVCFPPALELLKLLGQSEGDPFRAAATFWEGLLATPQQAETSETSSTPDKQRPRRKRPRSRKRKPTEDKPATPPPAKAERDDLPPPWDDNYFFAALPNAPKTEVTEDHGTRYGQVVSPDVEADVEADAASEEAAPEDTPETKPRRKRRPRRRKRGPKPKADKTEEDD
jgi:poly(A) polymerase